MQMHNSQKKLLLTWLFILLIPSIANAADISISSARIFIPIPKGYCLLKSSEPSDSRLIQYLEDTNQELNKVLMIFADCGQLKLWRNGELPNLDDYGYVLTPKSLINRKLDMSTRSYLFEVRKAFKAKGVELLNRNVENLGIFLNKHFPTMQLNETKNLGILSQDNNAIYCGILQNLQSEENKSKHMAGIMAMSLVKGKSVIFYLWKRYKGERTVYDLEALTSSWVSRTIAGN